MNVEEVVKLFVDNGITVVVIAYFMWFTNTTIKELQDTLSKINMTLAKICSRLDIDEKEG